MQFNMTFKLFKNSKGIMFDAYGMVLDESGTTPAGE
jgi:hypothetical protein